MKLLLAICLATLFVLGVRAHADDHIYAPNNKGIVVQGASISTIDSSNVITLTVPKSLIPFDVSIDGVGRLNPKPDITAEESAWLNVMLTIGIAYSHDNLYARFQPDYAAFVKLHHLERHFDKVTP